MHPYLDRTRPDIARELARLLAEGGKGFARAGRWGGEAARRLAGFASRGKMVRGSLLVLAWQMHGGAGGPTPRREALRAAAAVELLHSALLVHDDIIDGDRLRRGEATVFAQYEDAARRLGAASPERVGMGLGISAGDAAFFLALGELCSLDVEPSLGLALARLACREIASVGAGQMQDVALGAARRWPSRPEILAVYIYKTARYTFSLPLAAGALLAGARPAALGRLEQLGELLGTAFQVLDDDLGMFGSESETGKPVGADLREGKKTLLALELMRRARGAERRRLAALFGKTAASRREVAMVREAAERLGARQAALDAAARLARDAERIVSGLRVGAEYRQVLREIAAASLVRRS